MEPLVGHQEGSSSGLEWTGERFLPEAADSCLDTCYEHLHRYAFALQFVKGKKVLDIPCGEGYGADLLASMAESVTAVDIDEKSIMHAKNKYRRNNLEYLTGNMTSIPVRGQGIFDIVVCFEGIEHIEEQPEFLKDVKRLLKEDGMLLLSTPNKSYTSKHCNLNPYHQKELSFDEFEALLRKYFKDIKFYSQRIFVVSNIWALREDPEQASEFVIERGAEEFHFCGKDKKTAVLYIAAASDFPLIQSSRNSFLIDSSNSLLKHYEDQAEINERRAAELMKQAAELRVALEFNTPLLKKLERTFRKKFVYPIRDIFKGKICV